MFETSLVKGDTYQLRENQLLTMLLAMLPARLPVPKALPAMLEALLNLSHREKARVFMIVRTRAMTSKNC
jgi:hypothetical protein